jgi:hypothetical protein
MTTNASVERDAYPATAPRDDIGKTEKILSCFLFFIVI